MTSTIHADKIMNSSGDQDSGLDLLVNDQVKLKTANTDRVIVDASGRVGIGISPDTEFHVKGVTTVANFEGTGGSSFIGLKDSDDGTVGFMGVDGGSIKFQTSGSSYSDKLIINAAGHVTKPLTPAFDAAPTSSISHNTNPIPMANVRINNGSHFNGSNGTFTAPTTGTYFFYCNWLGSNSTTVHRFYFMYNGSAFNETHARIDQSQAEDYNATSLQFVKVLNANDTMAMKMTSDNNSSAAYSDAQPGYQGFGGFLLY